MDGFSKYHFKDVGADETIVRVIHRNWFYLFEQFFWLFVIAGLFFGGISIIPTMFPQLFLGVNQNVILFVENSFTLAIWVYGFLIWIDYYFDIWIITSERIVNIEQKGMFTRTVSELRYSKIQDITTEVVGFLPTIINFGDVKVQTAAEESEFLFRTVSDPYAVKSIIMELQKKTEAEKVENFGDMLKEKIEGE